MNRSIDRGAYPSWICAECGVNRGQMRVGLMSTYHEPDKNDPNDKCGWCGSRVKSLTEPRDFGYPTPP